jgi:hypothetical protein
MFLSTPISYSGKSQLSTMARIIPIRSLIPPASVLIFGWALLCLFAPWRQVHPADASLGHDLSRAPIWSHVYSGVPGARLDGSEFLLEAGIVLVVCLLLFGFYRNLRTVPSH